MLDLHSIHLRREVLQACLLGLGEGRGAVSREADRNRRRLAVVHEVEASLDDSKPREQADLDTLGRHADVGYSLCQRSEVYPHRMQRGRVGTRDSEHAAKQGSCEFVEHARSVAWLGSGHPAR